MCKEIIPLAQVAQSIVIVRGQRVLLDLALAQLYEVTTGNLNKAVSRNKDRFPADFVFRLTREEAQDLLFQFGISSWGGRRALPYAFTEQGVAMLSSVLRSERAVKVNLAITRAFVRLREVLETNRELGKKFSQLEKRVGKHDEEIGVIIEAIRPLMASPKRSEREIGFHVRETPPRYRTRTSR